MSDILHIENSEVGSSVRGKLNSVIDKVNTAEDAAWEVDAVTTIKPSNSKTVDASHLSGTLDGGPLHS